MDERDKQFWSKPHLCLIICIGVTVPRRFRARFRQEWEAELEYREAMLARWDKLGCYNKLELLWRSLGAFWDALWLQRQRSEDEMFQDLRYGARLMLKSKMFTLVAVLSLALGIGANTAIFSLINALMLRTLPVKDARELALFSVARAQGPDYFLTRQFYEMVRDRNQSFTGVIATGNVGLTRLTAPEPGAGGAVESVQRQDVSGNFFSVLGVGAVVGRTLTEADDNPANPEPAAVISHEFWQRRFGLDPAVVGRRITLNNAVFTIVGVAPPGFFGIEVGTRPELWTPIKALNNPNLGQRIAWTEHVMGRLRPGVSLAQAQAEMDVFFRQHLDELAGAHGANWTPAARQRHFETRVRLEAGSAGWTMLRWQFRTPLLILMMTVALVLLIACVNIANLLLARAASRRKEIAVRLSLGAGRFRLVRQLLTESLLLAALGGAAGLLFARMCLRALVVYLPQQTRSVLDVSLDARALMFTLAVSILTGLLFGLAPAWQATRLDLTSSLKDQIGASAGRLRMALNKLLVVTQVALSLSLLIGAGLFVRSLRNLRSLDAGINYENIVQFSIDPGGGYDVAQRANLYKQMLARLEALPGASSATFSTGGLLSGDLMALNVTVPGYTPAPDENMACNSLTVGPRFFETMKMPLLAGRDFGPQDERPASSGNNPGFKGFNQSQNLAEAPPLPAVINQAMARYFFGQQTPIGKRFTVRLTGQLYEIIGVVKDSKYMNLREHPPRAYYTYGSFRGTFQLRMDGDPAGYAAAIHRLAREIDPQLQVVRLRTMKDVVDDSLAQERFIAQIAGAFSLLALLLACVGLYGVMSYAVTRRTNEIGVRMALGARGADVVRMVMKETMLLVTVGMAIGLGAALAAMRLISTLLFGLSPDDPVTIAAAALLMIVTAALAGYLPARRAARVDPMAALRCE
jgi:predicted permease